MKAPVVWVRTNEPEMISSNDILVDAPPSPRYLLGVMIAAQVNQVEGSFKPLRHWHPLWVRLETATNDARSAAAIARPVHG